MGCSRKEAYGRILEKNKGELIRIPVPSIFLDVAKRLYQDEYKNQCTIRKKRHKEEIDVGRR